MSKKKMTKKIAKLCMYIAVLFGMIFPMPVMAATDIAIDATNFPDASFRAYVSTNCDTNKDGMLSQKEMNAVKSIQLRNMSISDLTGIQYFVNLKNLDCAENQLTILDVTTNSALQWLDCGNNQLTALDVNDCTALQYLDCSGNPWLTLNMSGCTALQYLECANNSLTTLDVSQCKSLQNLECANNSLTTLDVSSCTSLQNLSCTSNQLTTLDVSGCALLQSLECANNSLTTLDVSSCISLQKLSCTNNPLTTLNVSGCTSLQNLSCTSNQLTTLDVSSCTSLQSLGCKDNQLTMLDVSDCTLLQYLDCWYNQLTSLNLSSNTNLILYCSNNIYEITINADRTFDLSTLPGDFDVSKASNWNGGSVSGTILTVASGAEKISYTYDCGNGETAVFTLTLSTDEQNPGNPIPEVPPVVDPEPETPTPDQELYPKPEITTPSSSSSGFSGSYNHPIEALTVNNGDVTLSESNAIEGETVIATVKPDNGYGVAEVIVTDEDGNRIPVTMLGNGEYSFVMSAGKVKVETICKPAITLNVDSTNVNVFGKDVKNDVAPIITPEGRTMLPIRVIAEALGADVDWDADTQKVTITKGDTTIEIFIGANYAYVNGEKVMLDSPAFIDNNRTYLPVRFVSEYLGARVTWDAVTRTVTVIPE